MQPRELINPIDMKLNKDNTAVHLIFSNKKAAEQYAFQLEQNGIFPKRIRAKNNDNVFACEDRVNAFYLILESDNYTAYCQKPKNGSWLIEGKKGIAIFKEFKDANEFMEALYQCKLYAEDDGTTLVKKNIPSTEYIVTFTEENYINYKLFQNESVEKKSWALKQETTYGVAWRRSSSGNYEAVFQNFDCARDFASNLYAKSVQSVRAMNVNPNSKTFHTVKTNPITISTVTYNGETFPQILEKMGNFDSFKKKEDRYAKQLKRFLALLKENQFILPDMKKFTMATDLDLSNQCKLKGVVEEVEKIYSQEFKKFYYSRLFKDFATTYINPLHNTTGLLELEKRVINTPLTDKEKLDEIIIIADERRKAWVWSHSPDSMNMINATQMLQTVMQAIETGSVHPTIKEVTFERKFKKGITHCQAYKVAMRVSENIKRIEAGEENLLSLRQTNQKPIQAMVPPPGDKIQSTNVVIVTPTINPDGMPFYPQPSPVYTSPTPAQPLPTPQSMQPVNPVMTNPFPVQQPDATAQQTNFPLPNFWKVKFPAEKCPPNSYSILFNEQLDQLIGYQFSDEEHGQRFDFVAKSKSNYPSLAFVIVTLCQNVFRDGITNYEEVEGAIQNLQHRAGSDTTPIAKAPSFSVENVCCEIMETRQEAKAGVQQNHLFPLAAAYQSPVDALPPTSAIPLASPQPASRFTTGQCLFPPVNSQIPLVTTVPNNGIRNMTPQAEEQIKPFETTLPIYKAEALFSPEKIPGNTSAIHCSLNNECVDKLIGQKLDATAHAKRAKYYVKSNSHYPSLVFAVKYHCNAFFIHHKQNRPTFEEVVQAAEAIHVPYKSDFLTPLEVCSKILAQRKQLNQGALPQEKPQQPISRFTKG